MYDYRPDLENIVKAVGSSEPELKNGIIIINSAMNLVKHLQTDVKLNADYLNLMSDIDSVLGCLTTAQANYKATHDYQAILSGLQANLQSIDFKTDDGIKSIAQVILNCIHLLQLREQINADTDTASELDEVSVLSEQLQHLTDAILNNVTGALRNRDFSLEDHNEPIYQKAYNLYHQLTDDKRRLLKPVYTQFLGAYNWGQKLISNLNENIVTVNDSYQQMNDALLKFGLESDPKKKLILANLISKQAKILQSISNPILSEQNIQALINLPTAFAEARQKELNTQKIAQLPANCYWAQRRLSGLSLIDQAGNQREFYPESVIHQFDYQTGDMLRSIIKNNKLIIQSVEKHANDIPSLDYSEIDEFKFAVVKNYNGRFLIDHDIYNNELLINDNPVSIEIDRAHYRDAGIKVEDGTLCDLAWYSDDPRLETNPNEAVAIRWVHREDNIQPAGKSNNTSKSVTDSEKHRQDAMGKNTDKLDLDLHGQTVCIAVGRGLNKLMAKRLVEEYNGKAKIIDAFSIRKHKLVKTLTGVDIVILIQSMANHSSSWNLISALRTLNVKFAVSANLSTRSIERALYRAEHRLKAFEPTNSEVDYPMA